VHQSHAPGKRLALSDAKEDCGPTMTRTHSTAEAKARFSEMVREAEKGLPAIITRHGKPVAAVVGMDDYTRIQRLKAAGPAGGLASVAGGWEGSQELSELLSEPADPKSR